MWCYYNPYIKWIVEYVPNSGGYIRFKSAYSNLYLGIDPSTVTAVKQYAANNYTSWTIDRTTSGNLILTNKATESTGRVLSIPASGANNNGTNLTQAVYTNNTDLADEWCIKKCEYLYTIYNYYDVGFDVRFTDASDRIISYQMVCSEILMQIFGVETEIAVIDYISCADECSGTEVTFDETKNACSHNGGTHKTRHAIRTDLIQNKCGGAIEQ